MPNNRSPTTLRPRPFWTSTSRWKPTGESPLIPRCAPTVATTIRCERNPVRLNLVVDLFELFFSIGVVDEDDETQTEGGSDSEDDDQKSRRRKKKTLSAYETAKPIVHGSCHPAPRSAATHTRARRRDGPNELAQSASVPGKRAQTPDTLQTPPSSPLASSRRSLGGLGKPTGSVRCWRDHVTRCVECSAFADGKADRREIARASQFHRFCSIVVVKKTFLTSGLLSKLGAVRALRPNRNAMSSLRANSEGESSESVILACCCS